MPRTPRPASRSSTRRQVQAAQTRADILGAAQALFLRQGFAATSVDAIAQEANVARATVFATLGSKVEILKILRDRALAGDDEPIPVVERPWFREVIDEPDQRQTLHLHARNVTMINQRAAGLEAALAAGADADPQLRDLYADSLRQRSFGAGVVAELLSKKAPLRAGVDIDTAADLLFALAGPDLYRLLVVLRGWTAERYQAWLTDTLIAQLAS
jgi:AcrR family transcriptional regulator